MEQLLKKLKNAPIVKTETSEEEQLKYLEETGLNDIVNKGLVELYRVQPENPIYFLASFLINEDKSNKKHKEEGYANHDGYDSLRENERLKKLYKEGELYE